MTIRPIDPEWIIAYDYSDVGHADAFVMTLAAPTPTLARDRLMDVFTDKWRGRVRVRVIQQAQSSVIDRPHEIAAVKTLARFRRREKVTL